MRLSNIAIEPQTKRHFGEQICQTSVDSVLPGCQDIVKFESDLVKNYDLPRTHQWFFLPPHILCVIVGVQVADSIALLDGSSELLFSVLADQLVHVEPSVGRIAPQK